MASVLVLSGATKREDVEGDVQPDFTVDSVADLPALLGAGDGSPDSNVAQAVRS